MKNRLKAETRRAIRQIFDRLDYDGLGPIYCDEGGETFGGTEWRTMFVCNAKGKGLKCYRQPHSPLAITAGCMISLAPSTAQLLTDLQL